MLGNELLLVDMSVTHHHVHARLTAFAMDPRDADRKHVVPSVVGNDSRFKQDVLDELHRRRADVARITLQRFLYDEVAKVSRLDSYEGSTKSSDGAKLPILLDVIVGAVAIPAAVALLGFPAHNDGAQDGLHAALCIEQVVEARHLAGNEEGVVNHRSNPPGIYPRHIARYAGTASRKVEDICRKLGIERWSLGLLGRGGQSVPLSIEETKRIIGFIRAEQGKRFLSRHAIRHL